MNDKLNKDSLEFVDTNEIADETPAVQNKKKLPGKIKIPVIIVSVVLLAFVILIVLNTNKPKYIFKKNSIFFDYGNEFAVVLFSNKFQKIPEAPAEYNIQSDVHESVAAFTGKSGNLYLVTPDNYTVVDSQVEMYSISDSGNFIAYISKKDGKNTLISYNIKKGVKSLVAENLPEISKFTFITISPDGKTICYSDDYDSSTPDFSCYISVNGNTPVLLGRNKFCLAVSDNAKYIYYAQCENGVPVSFHAKTKNYENKIEFTSPSFIHLRLILNIDYSEAIVASYNEDGFISIKAGNFIKLDNIPGDMIVPHNTVYRRDNFGTIFYIYKYGVSTLADKLYIFRDREYNYMLYNLDENYNALKITSDIGYNALITKDGKCLLYRDDESRLIKCSLSGGQVVAKENISVNNSVSSFDMSLDGSKIYYVVEGSLWFKNGNMPPVKVSDGLHGSIVYDDKDEMIFFIKYFEQSGEEILYYSKNGHSPEAVKDINITIDIVKRGSNIICCVIAPGMDPYTYELYFKSGYAQFEKFFEVAWE